ncbi:MAG: nitroreductase family protein [Pseudohongiellaceae bacterium]
MYEGFSRGILIEHWHIQFHNFSEVLIATYGLSNSLSLRIECDCSRFGEWLFAFFQTHCATNRIECKTLTKEVLALAMRSPSSMNTKPWNFTVVSGEPLDRIRAGNTERNLAGVPHSREFRIGAAYVAFAFLASRWRFLLRAI